MGAVEEAEEVELDHSPPFLDRCTHDGAEEHDAGIVDERVQSPELVHGSLDRRPGLGLVGDVGLEHEDAGSVAETSSQRLEPVATAGSHGHVGPGGDERSCRGLTDSARCAGHECDGAIEGPVAHRLHPVKAGPSRRVLSANGA